VKAEDFSRVLLNRLSLLVFRSFLLYDGVEGVFYFAFLVRRRGIFFPGPNGGLCPGLQFCRRWRAVPPGSCPYGPPSPCFFLRAPSFSLLQGYFFFPPPLRSLDSGILCCFLTRDLGYTPTCFRVFFSNHPPSSHWMHLATWHAVGSG